MDNEGEGPFSSVLSLDSGLSSEGFALILSSGFVLFLFVEPSSIMKSSNIALELPLSFWRGEGFGEIVELSVLSTAWDFLPFCGLP